MLILSNAEAANAKTLSGKTKKACVGQIRREKSAFYWFLELQRPIAGSLIFDDSAPYSVK